MKPDDPAKELKTGPSDTWRPGSHHLTKITVWGNYLESLGIPKYKAEAIAFALWKIGQKIETRT